MPKIRSVQQSKPGDALKAILERKQAEAAAKAAPPATSRPHGGCAAVGCGSGASGTRTRLRDGRWLRQRLHQRRRTRTSAAAPLRRSSVRSTSAPAPRRIVPLPRQGANIVAPPAPPPAIASRPPVGPVIARPPPVVVAPPAATEPRPAVVAAPSTGCVRLVAAAPPSRACACAAAPPLLRLRPSAPVGSACGASRLLRQLRLPRRHRLPRRSGCPRRRRGCHRLRLPPAAPAGPPVRRVMMPQTGPRPIYTAPPPAPGATAAWTADL